MMVRMKFGPGADTDPDADSGADLAASDGADSDADPSAVAGAPLPWVPDSSPRGSAPEVLSSVMCTG